MEKATKTSKKLKKALERTYLHSCADENKKTICCFCCWKECKKWYELGLKDGKKRKVK